MFHYYRFGVRHVSAQNPGVTIKLESRLLGLQTEVEILGPLLVFKPRRFHLAEHPDARKHATESAPVRWHDGVFRPFDYPVERLAVECSHKGPLLLAFPLEVDATDKVVPFRRHPGYGVLRQDNVRIAPEHPRIGVFIVVYNRLYGVIPRQGISLPVR